MKKLRKIIEIKEELCNGCGKCVISCAEGAIKIQNGKAKLLADWLCDGIGACIGECPTGAISIIEREAEEFDAEAAQEFIKIKRQEEESGFFRCPSVGFENFFTNHQGHCKSPNKPISSTVNNLRNWPIKINLIQSDAPFLKDEDILVSAHCVPPACFDFHDKILKNSILIMACPKFDDDNFLINRLTEIFSKNSPKSLKIAIMEVPCCFSLEYLIKKAMEKAGKSMEINKLVVDIKGEVR